MPPTKKSKSPGSNGRPRATWPVDTRLKLAEVAFIAGALVVAFLAWWFPRGSEPPAKVTQEEEAAGPATPSKALVAPAEPKQDESKVGVSRGEPGRPSAKPTEPGRVSQRFEPVEFRLKSGEQRVILNGLVGLSVEQSGVGEMQVLTLRITPSGGPQLNKAVLGGGARAEFRAGGQTYIVSVLSWDERAREAVLRVDRKS